MDQDRTAAAWWRALLTDRCGGHVKAISWLRAGASAVSLCAAFAVHAAPSPVAPACLALATNLTWADCAAPFSRQGPFDGGPGQAVGGRDFDAAIDEDFEFDGAAAPISAVDYTSSGASDNRHRAGNVQTLASSFGTQPLPAIPEPQTSLLMLAGLAAFAFMATRRRRP